MAAAGSSSSIAHSSVVCCSILMSSCSVKRFLNKPAASTSPYPQRILVFSAVPCVSSASSVNPDYGCHYYKATRTSSSSGSPNYRSSSRTFAPSLSSSSISALPSPSHSHSSSRSLSSSLETGFYGDRLPVQSLSKVANCRQANPRFLANKNQYSSIASLNVSSPTILAAIALSAAIASVSLSLMGSISISDRQKKKLQVVLGEGAMNQELSSKLTILNEPYKPALGMRNRHFETIFAAVFRTRPKVTFRRECLRMADGGTVALDWPIMGEDVELWRQPLPKDAPYLILLPGLTGGSDDTYVRHLLLRARGRGWGVVVFNSRGCASSPVTSPQFYSASFTEDLRQVIKRVGVALPHSRLYAMGWSLGANILVRYLGQEGEQTPLSGAVSLCNPFDLVLADKNFHIGFNNFYDQRLAVALNKIFKKHASLFEGIGGDYNIPLVANAKTVREFDDGLTRVSFGYATVDDYYSDASSSRMIKKVKIPLLCVQAEDDPIAPIEGVPVDDIKANPNCMLVTTPFGGHLGWVAGEDSPLGAPWTDPLTMDYLHALEAMMNERKGSSGSEKAHGEDGVARLVDVSERGERVEESSSVR